MDELAALMEEISSTSKTSQKVSLAAKYLKEKMGEELALATRYLSGYIFPPGEPLILNIGWSLILDIFRDLGLLEENWQQIYRQFGDLGSMAFYLLQGASERKSPSLDEVDHTLREIAAIKGKASRDKKREVLREFFLKFNPLALKYLIRIILGDLRIGITENLVEQAITQAFYQPLTEVRRANLLISDIGEVAKIARDGALEKASLSLGRPFRFMLAQSIATPQELPPGKCFFAEDKYDGIRAQIHHRKGQTMIFSRNLAEIGSSFPELKIAFKEKEEEFILDGEIVAYKDGILPFSLLQRRLHRRRPEEAEEIPVHYFVFDLLCFEGKALLSLPFLQRRKMLGELSLPDSVTLAHQEEVCSPQDVENVFKDSLQRGNEGLVLKDPRSYYLPGKRGRQWLKYKKGLDTLDCLVVAVEWGHGKRAGLLSDYTFAVRGEKGEYLNVGKAFSGLTDEEIKSLTDWFLKHKLRDLGWKIEVEPKIVVEVTFNGIQKSSRHQSGFALRFPRILRLREDKSPQEIDTIEKVREIYEKAS